MNEIKQTVALLWLTIRLIGCGKGNVIGNMVNKLNEIRFDVFNSLAASESSPVWQSTYRNILVVIKLPNVKSLSVLSLTGPPSSELLLDGSLCLLAVTGIAAGIVYINERKKNSEIINSLKRDLVEKNNSLDTANEKNDWLIKEIHHRVKNNLQIVMSLLNTQAAYLDHPEAQKAIRNFQHRMFAVSLVYRRSYQEENLSRVEMADYTYELLEYLEDVYDNCSKQIEFNVELVPLDLEVSMAVSYGLILNEAVSNVFKYAFAGKKGVKVDLSLITTDVGKYCLSIADNGVGDNRRKSWHEKNSFGKVLIEGLARQLGGGCEMKGKNGLEVEICVAKKMETADVAVNIE
ncbi:sensor histidine kinase [Mucilaginibacter sp. cycad4]|uniref:sensor histidine kinase n=1 Tax=Mucilaginibacter sp. cycad4 TaxID=3342096 RepID=UPI002AAAB738|nr:sensor histidine kinase [Mucilaginibacter gossypii]WPU99131.1 sensor histidine kinase [Mucilaginibacter gossypii]